MSTATRSTSGNVLHLIHLRSQRTNRNRANQRGEDANDLFSGSLWDGKSRLSRSAAEGGDVCSTRLLLWRLPVRTEQRQQQFNFFLGTDLNHSAHINLLCAFDERRRPRVHAIWFQACFRTVSSARPSTTLSICAPMGFAPAEAGDQRSTSDSISLAKNDSESRTSAR